LTICIIPLAPRSCGKDILKYIFQSPYNINYSNSYFRQVRSMICFLCITMCHRVQYTHEHLGYMGSFPTIHHIWIQKQALTMATSISIKNSKYVQKYSKKKKKNKNEPIHFQQHINIVFLTICIIPLAPRSFNIKQGHSYVHVHITLYMPITFNV
jgi:hypothetical protein